MIDLSTKNRQQVLMELLFLALKDNKAALNERAAYVLGQSGTGPVRRLVLEAASPRNGLPHRLRLLAVIERVGQLSGPNDWMDLSVLAADDNPHLRAAAGRCLARCPISNA